jgi:hypothetical protein
MRLAQASARFLALALVAGLASGCFLNEIDKSVESAKSASERKAEATAKGEAPAAKPAKGGGPKQTASADAPKGQSWWATATTLGSEESTADIVACQLSGKVDFMTRDDCLARGGATK